METRLLIDQQHLAPSLYHGCCVPHIHKLQLLARSCPSPFPYFCPKLLLERVHLSARMYLGAFRGCTDNFRAKKNGYIFVWPNLRLPGHTQLMPPAYTQLNLHTTNAAAAAVL